MKKIEIISSRNMHTLQYQANQFIAEHKVLGIQYQASGNGYYNYSVMIVYEEE